MGVSARPRANPHPTEEEIARAAGLVPGSAEEAKFLAMRQELDEKGFLVATTRRPRHLGAHRLACGG